MSTTIQLTDHDVALIKELHRTFYTLQDAPFPTNDEEHESRRNAWNCYEAKASCVIDTLVQQLEQQK